MPMLWTWIVLSLIGCDAAPHLRLSRRIQVQDSINLCFCEGCTPDLEATLADGHSCAKRIAWLQSDRNFTEIDACRRVAVDEYPDECGACNPDSCQVQSFCGVTTCTMDVLETDACDDSMNGCHQCGERIRYLVDSQSIAPKDACEKVASQQFPVECGRCSDNIGTLLPRNARSSVSLTTAPVASPTVVPATSLTAAPAGRLTMSPVANPTVDPSILESAAATLPSELGIVAFESGTNVCGTATCTQTVLNTLACNDNMGGCHTCGSRIDYLVNQLSYSTSDACELVGFSQFVTECGGCMPDHLKAPVLAVDPSKLVWSDEFNENGTPDPTKWTFEIGNGDWGWGNGELQYYTDRAENAFVMDGILNIRAIRESYGGKDYTSARLKTKLKGDWTYGRIQIRARLANVAGRGTWAALWMLPTDQIYGQWPDSGEIDIMEHVGYDPGRFHGTVHTGAFNHMRGTQNGNDMAAALNDWHVYEIDWSADKIDFIIDGSRFHTFRRQESSTFREWPFDERFHLILNIAVGGTWGAAQGVDEAAFTGVGQIMEIDWVRVYSV